MQDLLKTLQMLRDTPVPVILVGGGVLFLFVAVGGQLGAKVSTDKVKQRYAAITGILLLLAGIGLYVVPSVLSTTPPPTPTDITDATFETQTAIPTPLTSTPEEKPLDTPTPEPPSNTPVPEPTNTSTPKPTVATSSIVFPQNETTVGESVIVRGTISGLESGQRAFLVVKSTAFSRLIYPQGEIFPDPTGQWAVESVYGSVGYKYETFVAATNNSEAANMLANGYYRTYGMSSLPQDTIIIGPVIVVTRE